MATGVIAASDNANGSPGEVDIGRAIDDGRWTGYQKLVLLLVGSAIIFDGFDNQSLGLAAPAIIKDWGISKEMLAPILAIGQMGMMAGTAFGGMLGDRIGRKVALIGSVLIFGIATILMSLAPDVTTLGILRVIAGLGLGGALPNAAALVSEYTPARNRSLAVTASIVCVPLGGVIGGLIAARLLPATGWQSLFALAGGIPIFVAILLYVALPESARFMLARQGDTPRLRATLKRAGLSVPENARLIDSTSGSENGGKTSTRDLVSSEYRGDTFALWGAFGFCLLAIYAGFSWLPTMLSDAGYDLSLSSTGLMAFNLGGVIAALGSAWLIGYSGSRKPMVAMAIGGLVTAIALFLFPLTPAQPVIIMILALGLLGGFVNGVQTTLYALAAHIYPVGIRASGVGAASSIGRIGAISSSFIGAAMLTALGSAGFYALMILAMGVTTVALMLIRRHSARTA